jgi:hypothetical protein
MTDRDVVKIYIAIALVVAAALVFAVVMFRF